LAFDEIDKSGGSLGRQVVHLVEDNRSTAGESVTIVKKFVSPRQGGGNPRRGGFGTFARRKPHRCGQTARVPMVSPSSTNT
jgi:ABC-type branched-subunit amino acid transport system substrate-binding protein